MNYYNEIDEKTAAWLRELIKQGHLPPGDVDTRSIIEVKPDDLKQYTQCHFFAGIGGWPLALSLAGWNPDTPVWTGSCPCQPFSTAGKGLAQKDERHLWPVFFDLIRQCRPEHVFGEQVASAIGHGWLDGVSSDLETEGYACGATVLGAHSVNAPHQRQRLYWVAHSELQHERPTRPHEAGLGYTAGSSEADGLDDTRRPSDERRGEFGDVGRSAGEEQSEARQRQRQWGRNADSGSGADDHGMANTNGIRSLDGINREEGQGPEAITKHCSSGWSDFSLAQCRDGKARRIPTEPAFFPLAHGIPARVVRLRGYGNAIVPQVAAEFVSAYLETL